jgi:hypothetical protein
LSFEIANKGGGGLPRIVLEKVKEENESMEGKSRETERNWHPCKKTLRKRSHNQS